MKHEEKSGIFCCLCFDKRSALLVIAIMALFHSTVTVVLGCRVISESKNVDHVYVVAVSIKVNDASQSVKDIFYLLSAVKVVIFSFHLLSNISMIGAVCYRSELLRFISPIFVLTEISAMLYTSTECLFAFNQLQEDMSRALLAVVMIVSTVFMGWCIRVVVCYSRDAKLTALQSRIITIRRNENAQHLVLQEMDDQQLIHQDIILDLVKAETICQEYV